LLVSHTESRSGVPDMLDCDWKYAKLDAGDYEWTDIDNRRIVVERKTISDFLHSMKDGRLGEPIDRLRQAHVSVLLLEGYPKELRGKVANERGKTTGWPYTSFLGQLWKLSYGAGLILMYTPSPKYSAYFLSSAYRMSQLESFGNGYIKASRWTDHHMNPIAKSYTGLPGISRHLAEQLFDRYPTWSKLVAAKQEGLTKVAGFGKTRAEKLFRFLHVS